MPSKKFRDKFCVYCAHERATTGDHVLAREFFPPDRRDGLPKAPACPACNSRKSALEGYLTTIMPFGSTHATALRGQTPKVARRLDRNARLRRELREGARHVLVPGADGRVVPMLALPLEGQRLTDYFEFVVRGLIWHEWGALVPDEYLVEVMTVTQHGYSFFRDFVLKMNAAGRREASFADDGLRYVCTRNSTDPAFSAWHVTVYGGLVVGGAGDDERERMEVCALTGPPALRSMMDKFLALDDEPGAAASGGE